MTGSQENRAWTRHHKASTDPAAGKEFTAAPATPLDYSKAKKADDVSSAPTLLKFDAVKEFATTEEEKAAAPLTLPEHDAAKAADGVSSAPTLLKFDAAKEVGTTEEERAAAPPTPLDYSKAKAADDVSSAPTLLKFAAAKEVANTEEEKAAAPPTPLEHDAILLNFTAAKEEEKAAPPTPLEHDAADYASSPRTLLNITAAKGKEKAAAPTMPLRDLKEDAAEWGKSVREDAHLGEKEKLIAVSMYDLSPDSFYNKLLPVDRSAKSPIKYLPASASPRQIHDAASRLMFTYNQGGSRRARESEERAAADLRKRPAASEQRKGKPSSSSSPPAAEQRASFSPSAAPVYTTSFTAPDGQIVWRDCIPSKMEMALAGFLVGPNYPEADSSSSADDDDSHPKSTMVSLILCW